MWGANPHGAGFMYPSLSADGRPSVKTVKGIMSFTALKRELQRRKDEFANPDNTAKVDIALHFRIASAGGQSAFLTHPFGAGDDVALMHNGHITMLAYESNDVKKLLPGASRPVSKGEQQTLAAFKDEVAGWRNRLNKLLKGGVISQQEYDRYELLYGDTEDQEEFAKRHEAARTDFEKLSVVPESDTSRLADILSRLPRGWQRNDVMHYLIAEQFLKGDRLVLFDAKGLAKIIGEGSGTLHRGVWYSNDYWIPIGGKTRIVSGREMLAESNTDTSFSNGKVFTPGRHPKASDWPGAYRGYPHSGYEGGAWDGDSTYYQRRGNPRRPANNPVLGNTITTLTPEAGAGAKSLPPGESSEAPVTDDALERVIRELPEDVPPCDWVD